MILQNGITLYHGSYTEVKNINLSLCSDGKDFGKGFYLASDLNQAVRFVKTAVGKAKKNGIEGINSIKGFVSSFQFVAKKNILVFEFDSADREWLHCVVAHRRRGFLIEELKKWQDFDIIAGKIANDTTNSVITAYINGAYGKVGSESADTIAMQLLFPNKLKEQICFRTEKSVMCLSFLKSEEIRIY